jgi:hypothetical protein
MSQILEKNMGENERVKQQFINFKKAYNSVRGEVLYNTGRTGAAVCRAVVKCKGS